MLQDIAVARRPVVHRSLPSPEKWLGSSALTGRSRTTREFPMVQYALYSVCEHEEFGVAPVIPM
jgi:hypothetical protein